MGTPSSDDIAIKRAFTSALTLALNWVSRSGSGLPAVVAKPGVPAHAQMNDPPLTEEEAARVEAALDQVREQLRDKDWYLNPFPPKRRAD